MKGTIAGDIIGSPYEFRNIRYKDFQLFRMVSRFTDDSVMTCAVMKILLDRKEKPESFNFDHIVYTFRHYGRLYPNAGYGHRFEEWIESDDPKPYNSYGNGAAMRISPVGFIAKSEDEAKELSKAITEVTHNHPEGLRGAECMAVLIYLARNGATKEELRKKADEYYIGHTTVDEWREANNGQHGAESCQVTVPQALSAFFDSTDYEDCIRNAVSMGGDSDTIAAIAGGLAEAFYGMDQHIWELALYSFDQHLYDIVANFYIEFNIAPMLELEKAEEESTSAAE